MLQILKMKEEQMKETKPATKYAGLGSAIVAEIMVVFGLALELSQPLG